MTPPYSLTPEKTTELEQSRFGFIRSARLADAEVLTQLHFQLLVDKTDEELRRIQTLWHHWLGGGKRRSQIFVILDEPEPVIGFLVISKARVLSHDYEFELIALYIRTERQRTGAGKFLLDYAVRKITSETPDPRIFARTEMNSPGAAFLRAQGWTESQQNAGIPLRRGAKLANFREVVYSMAPLGSKKASGSEPTPEASETSRA